MKLLKYIKKGASVSDDDLEAFIAADKRIQSKGTSDEMLEYQKEYEKAGGGILGFIIANAKTRGQVLPQIIVSSIATMATSLESGEVRTSAAAGAGTGAVVGSVATPYRYYYRCCSRWCSWLSWCYGN